MKTLQCSCVNVPAKYICVVPALGAYKSQLGGHISYRCCFIRSMSTVIIRLYIFVKNHSSCHFIVGVFARPMHFTSEFAKIVLSKCVCVCMWEVLQSTPLFYHTFLRGISLRSLNSPWGFRFPKRPFLKPKYSNKYCKRAVDTPILAHFP